MLIIKDNVRVSKGLQGKEVAQEGANKGSRRGSGGGLKAVQEEVNRQSRKESVRGPKAAVSKDPEKRRGPITGQQGVQEGISQGSERGHHTRL